MLLRYGEDGCVGEARLILHKETPLLLKSYIHPGNKRVSIKAIHFTEKCGEVLVLD